MASPVPVVTTFKPEVILTETLCLKIRAGEPCGDPSKFFSALDACSREVIFTRCASDRRSGVTAFVLADTDTGKLTSSVVMRFTVASSDPRPFKSAGYLRFDGLEIRCKSDRKSDDKESLGVDIELISVMNSTEETTYQEYFDQLEIRANALLSDEGCLQAAFIDEVPTTAEEVYRMRGIYSGCDSDSPTVPNFERPYVTVENRRSGTLVTVSQEREARAEQKIEKVRADRIDLINMLLASARVDILSHTDTSHATRHMLAALEGIFAMCKDLALRVDN